MTRYKYYVDLPDSLDPEELKLNSGFEMADAERARLELRVEYRTGKKVGKKKMGRPRKDNARARDVCPA